MEDKQDSSAQQKIRQRLDALASRLFWRWSSRLDSDSVEDCRQEVSLLLWRIQDKLDALPDEEQIRYSYVSAHNLILALLQRELKHKTRNRSFEEISRGDSRFIETFWQTDHEESSFFEQNWFDTISRPGLVDALSALPPHQYRLIDLYYGQGLTDIEISTRLNMSAGSIRVQRNRILAHLRQMLRLDNA